MGHWLFRKLLLCQKKKKQHSDNCWVNRQLCRHCAVWCFFSKGHKFSMTPDCLFRLLPEGELSKNAFNWLFYRCYKNQGCAIKFGTKVRQKLSSKEGLLGQRVVLHITSFLLCIVFIWPRNEGSEEKGMWSGAKRTFHQDCPSVGMSGSQDLSQGWCCVMSKWCMEKHSRS